MGRYDAVQYRAGWTPRPGEVRPEQERADERRAIAAQKRFKRRMAIALWIAIPALFVIFGCTINIIFPENATQQRTHDRIVHRITHPFGD